MAMRCNGRAYVTYAHQAGELRFRRTTPLQITMYYSQGEVSSGCHKGFEEYLATSGLCQDTGETQKHSPRGALGSLAATFRATTFGGQRNAFRIPGPPFVLTLHTK